VATLKKCLLCGRKAKYVCDGGCCDDEIAYCGYCSRLKIVTFIGRAMKQRLCAVCALREEKDGGKADGIYDARYYSVSDFTEPPNTASTGQERDSAHEPSLSNSTHVPAQGA
jgi:hypothetical protein